MVSKQCNFTLFRLTIIVIINHPDEYNVNRVVIFLFSFLGGLSPLTITTLVLIASVIFVNGLTDAPNAVATCITTRCITLKKAVFLSAVFNLLGVLIMSRLSPAVTETILNMVDFGNDKALTSIALAAALFSIVLWAVVAWYFGIPTSESHALIAGISGSAIALTGGFQAINISHLLKAFYGLFISCFGGFIAGFIICRLIVFIFRNTSRRHTEAVFRYGEIFAACCMSFMHGAQDGQKFIATLMLTLSLSQPQDKHQLITTVFCSVIIALGTLTGGKKIIKEVGINMVKLEKYQGFSADIASSLMLLFCTLFGLPVSTTHTKTTAMMGSGFSKKRSSLNPSVIKDIFLTWVLTFPGCGLLGFVVTKIFLKIF